MRVAARRAMTHNVFYAMITVNFFATLRTLLKTKQIRVHTDEINVLNLLQFCETQTAKPFLDKLLDEQGQLMADAMILVNGQNVLQLQGTQTVVRNGADIAVFPSGKN